IAPSVIFWTDFTSVGRTPAALKRFAPKFLLCSEMSPPRGRQPKLDTNHADLCAHADDSGWHLQAAERGARQPVVRKRGPPPRSCRCHETAVLCVPANVCSWGESGRAADITAKTDFEPQAVFGSIHRICLSA